MSKLNDRENAFEKKYAHDEKMNFKIEARCSKLYGLWVAEKLGFSATDALAYAGDIISANLEKPGFENVHKKVRADLDAKNVDLSDHALQVQFEKTLEEARAQVLSEISP